MIFWTGVLFASGLAYLGWRIGFYQSFAMVLNVLIAIYLAITTHQGLIGIVPGLGENHYNTALAMLAIAAGSFIVLHGLIYTVFLGQFDVVFPRLMEFLGSVVLGFMGGFLVWNFLLFVVSITPLGHAPALGHVGLPGSYEDITYLARSTGALHSVVSNPARGANPKDQITYLLQMAELNARTANSENTDPQEDTDQADQNLSEESPD